MPPCLAPAGRRAASRGIAAAACSADLLEVVHHRGGIRHHQGAILLAGPGALVPHQLVDDGLGASVNVRAGMRPMAISATPRSPKSREPVVRGGLQRIDVDLLGRNQIVVARAQEVAGIDVLASPSSSTYFGEWRKRRWLVRRNSRRDWVFLVAVVELVVDVLDVHHHGPSPPVARAGAFRGVGGGRQPGVGQDDQLGSLPGPGADWRADRLRLGARRTAAHPPAARCARPRGPGDAEATNTGRPGPRVDHHQLAHVRPGR